MDLTHLHLMITHLPVYGSILGALILIYGMVTQSRHTKMAAYYVLLISSLGGVIAFSTGEAAEETVENMQGVSRDLIEKHEEFAKFTLGVIIVLVVTSLAGLLVTWKNAKPAKAVSVITLVVSLVCIGMTSRTGYLGGQIRHTEIVHGSGQTQDAGEKHEN
jgi:uncharacterized membrane protein